MSGSRKEEVTDTINGALSCATKRLSFYDPIIESVVNLPFKKTSLEPGSLYDAHCHYDILFRRLKVNSYDEYCRFYGGGDFRENYMGGVITCFSDPRSWSQPMIRDLIAEMELQPRIYFSFGCHPRKAKYFDEPAICLLEDLLKTRKKVVALGEIGLDYVDIEGRPTSSKNCQKLAFRAQLRLALKLGIPLVLHIRNAEKDALEILKEEGIPKDYLMHRHCMTGSWSAAQKWINEFPNSKIGLTNLVNRPDALHAHELARRIPLNKLLLETDAPYFCTRTRNNIMAEGLSYPALVVEAAKRVADLRQKESLNEILRAVRCNTEELFQLSKHDDAKTLYAKNSVGCQTYFAKESCWDLQDLESETDSEVECSFNETF